MSDIHQIMQNGQHNSVIPDSPKTIGQSKLPGLRTILDSPIGQLSYSSKIDVYIQGWYLKVLLLGLDSSTSPTSKKKFHLPQPSLFQVAENLALFRRWCFATYGGVAIAFHALDADGSGSLSEEEFVTVIEHSSFKGDARAAWNALNLEGSDILSEA